eukprot:5324491-Ditylum_brightwellii.AAC.1
MTAVYAAVITTAAYLLTSLAATTSPPTTALSLEVVQESTQAKHCDDYGMHLIALLVPTVARDIVDKIDG